MTIQNDDSDYRAETTRGYPEERADLEADITNTDRAMRANTALAAFISQAGHDGAECDALSDLIADIGYLCDADDIDYLATIRRAIGHWYSEKQADSTDPLGLMPEVRITIDGAEP